MSYVTFVAQRLALRALDEEAPSLISDTHFLKLVLVWVFFVYVHGFKGGW